MTTGFKHIHQAGESRLESLGDPVEFYVWEKVRGVWCEKCWSFSISAQTTDGITAIGFVVSTKFAIVGSIPEERCEVFDDLDKASQWVNDQVSQKMGWGYRTVRMPQPTVVV